MSFKCDSNILTSLLGAPRFIKGSFSCLKNEQLTDCSDLWNSEITGKVLVKFNVIFISTGPKIDPEILHKHRGDSKQNIIDFQFDLIENDLAEYAKWKP